MVIMKKIVFVIIFFAQLIACSNNSSEGKQGKHYNLPVNKVQNGIRLLNIDPIQYSADLNAVWFDNKTIIIMVDSYHLDIDENGLPRPEKIDWNRAMFEFYRYSLNDDRIEKIFEYPMGDEPYFLYLKMLNNGDLAFKTRKKFVCYSFNKKNVTYEYSYPFENMELSMIDISPDGKKIAYFLNDNKITAVIDHLKRPGSKNRIEKLVISGVSFLNYPIWSSDCRYILAYSPTIGDLIDSVTIIDTANKRYRVNRYNNSFSDNARVYWGNKNEAYIKYDYLDSGVITLEEYNTATGFSKKIPIPDGIEKKQVASWQIEPLRSTMVLTSLDFSDADKPDGKTKTSFTAFNYGNGKYFESEKFIGYGTSLVPLISPAENAAIVFMRKIPVPNNQSIKSPWVVGIFNYDNIR